MLRAGCPVSIVGKLSIGESFESPAVKKRKLARLSRKIFEKKKDLEKSIWMICCVNENAQGKTQTEKKLRGWNAWMYLGRGGSEYFQVVGSSTAWFIFIYTKAS